ADSSVMNSNLPSGSPGAPTIIAAYPLNCSRGTQYGPGPSCDQVIIRPGNIPYPPLNMGAPAPVSYMVLDGLVIHAINTGGAGVAFAADHVTFINMHILNTWSHGFIGTKPYGEFHNNKIVGPGRGDRLQDCGSSCHGMYFTSPNSIIDGNEFVGWVK